MKQGKIILEKQEFNSTISRFGMYLFDKIKKISVNPKTKVLVFDYVQICQSINSYNFSFFYPHNSGRT